MIIRGILDRTLQGVITIRGYAKLKDIIDISRAKIYQRDLDKKHKTEIENFITNRNFLFFPEVILSYQITEKDNVKLVADGIEKIRSKNNDLSFSITAKKYTSQRDFRIKEEVRIVTITIKDTLKDIQFFSRIDGNHRLSAAENLIYEKKEDSEGHIQCHINENIANYKIPFSIILISNDVEQGEAFESAIFYNINSKAKNLTSEENLKVILNKEYFSDEKLKDQFGWEFYVTRRIYTNLSNKNNLKFAFPYLGSNFLDRPRTFCKDLVDLLIEQKVIQKQSKTIENINEALSKVNVIIGNHQQKQKINTLGIIEAAVYFVLKENFSAPLFFEWVINNHIYDIKTIKAQTLIKIYEKICETKNKEIFISMAFCDNTKPHYDAIVKAIDEINHEYRLDISLKEIRIDHFNAGYSYDINELILKKIEESGLLIVDISMYNANVYHELGYIMGLNKAKNLKQNNFIIIKSDNQQFNNQKIAFNITTIQQLRFKDTLELVEKLKKSIKKYYNIS